MRPTVQCLILFLVASCLTFVHTSSLLATSGQQSSRSEIEQVPNKTLTSNGNLKARMDQYLTKASSELGFSGAVLVARGKEILLHRGYGWADRKKSFKVAPDTEFYIASITKQFTAVAILMLENQGKLNVTDPIGKYFRDAPKDKAEITVHQLLTHTSGLAQNYAADGIVDRNEAMRAILAGPLKSSKTYADGTVIIVTSNAGNISGVPARSLVSDELERIVFEKGVADVRR